MKDSLDNISFSNARSYIGSNLHEGMLDTSSIFYDLMFDISENARSSINILEDSVLKNVEVYLDHPEKIQDLIPLENSESLSKLFICSKDKSAFGKFLGELIDHSSGLKSHILGLKEKHPELLGQSYDDMQVLSDSDFHGLIQVSSCYLIKDILSSKPIYYDAFERLVWTHSLDCASACKNIALESEHFYSEAVYLVGLIHDLGKLVVSHCIIDAISSSLSNEKLGSKGFKVNLTQFSLELTALIAKTWGLPEEVTSCFSDQKVHTGSDDIASLLYKANLCSEMHQMVQFHRIQFDETKSTLTSMGFDEALMFSVYDTSVIRPYIQ